MSKSPRDRSATLVELRRRAESKLPRSAQEPSRIPREDVLELIHELEVNQAEIEIQNEDLIKNQGELEESRIKYADLFDFAPVGYLVLDKNGLVKESNVAAAQLLGIEKRYLTGRGVSRFIPRNSQDTFHLFRSRVFESRVREVCELQITSKDGATRDIQMSGIAAIDSEGNDLCQLALTDISAQKRAERELQQSHEGLETRVEERTAQLAKTNDRLRDEIAVRERVEEELRKAQAELEMRVRQRTEALASEIAERTHAEEQLRQASEFNQAVMANMGEGLYAVDMGGLVTYINPTAERLFGWPSAELLGRKMHDVTHYKHPDGTPFPGDECPGLQVLRQGISLQGQEDFFIRKDGTFFPVDYSSSPILVDGTIMGLVVVFRDLTARKRATEDLQRSAAWLRNLIATTQDAVVSIDRQGGVVLFNPAAERIFGYTAEEITGKKVNELMAKPYASEHDGYIERYERTGEARAIGRIRTVMAKRKDGEQFPIELSVTEIDVDQDVHYAAFIRDISEKSSLQKQLLESERLAAIGMTAAKIAHELNNPLNGMSLTVQLLEQRLARASNPLADDQATATVKRLKDEISRLNQLAGEFRAISRKERYDFRPTDLAPIIEDIVGMQAPHFAGHGIEIKSSMPPDLPPVKVDEDKIKQALLNLVKNAAEAMPGGGRISIGAALTDDAVALEIADTGTGIPLDVDAFEPFATTKKGGTGLGLVIVRQIITAHRGKISYRSRPGEGTTFRIDLPLSKSD